METLKRIKIFYAIAMIAGATACSPAIRAYKKLDTVHKDMADSLLLYALDHEALYTLLDTLKPMSSVKMLRYPLAADSTHVPATVPYLRNPNYLDTLAMYERVCRALSQGNKEWILVPFRQADHPYRNIQIYVVNKNAFQRKLSQYPAFFGQFGFGTLSSPSVVITQIENNETYDRWRGYGYLFGYPAHAVDFFVGAGKEQDSTGKFVERQLFNIPVMAAKEGYFTYALQKEYLPDGKDSAILQKSLRTLGQYKNQREKWIGQKSMKTKYILRSIEKYGRPEQ